MSLVLSRRRWFAALPILLLLLLTTTADRLHAADPATFSVGGLTFKRPDTWKWVVVNSQFRKAQLHVPDPTNPAGPGADVVFFAFGVGQGGDVDGNISRWVGQFAKPDGSEVKPVVEAASIKGTKVTRVRVDSGTFNSGMPGGPTTPMENYGLYGAIIEGPQGNVFVKLTGPADMVLAAAKNFEGLVQSPF